MIHAKSYLSINEGKIIPSNKVLTGLLNGLYLPLEIRRLKRNVIGRLAKINLVKIFDCDYRWYCAIYYVIVNYIEIHYLFIIFNVFLAINHLLCIKDGIK